MKKILVVLITLLLAMASATAEGKSDAKGSEGDSGVTTLKFMGWEASPLETESVKNGLAIFEQQNPDIKVEYTPVAGDYVAKLLTMMAGDSAPDVFFIAADQYRAFQKRNVLLDITDHMNQELNIDEFIPLVQEKMLIGDRVYGISSCNVSPLMFYNKDLFDAAGLSYPPSDPDKAWTWDEFVDVAKKLTITDGNRTTQFGATGFEVAWGWVFPPMVMSNGGSVLNDDYSKVTLNSPQSKEVFNAIRDLRFKHHVAPDVAFVEQSGMSAAQMLQTGRVAMMVDGSWALQQLATMDFPIGIGVLPIFDKPATVGQAHLHAAWAKTKHPEESWKLIKFLSSEDYQLSNVRAGLWLPNMKEMYKEENLSKWINPDVYPEDFGNIVKYFTNYGKLWPGVVADREAYDIINEEKDRFYAGDTSVDEMMANIDKRTANL